MNTPSDGVMSAVTSFFEFGKAGNFEAIKDLLADDPKFSSFGDVPPYGIHDAQTTVILEEMRLAAISDYNYAISDEHVSITGDFAIATFTLRQNGILVDNKTFSGKTIDVESRSTFVLVLKESWKIVHIHISRVIH